MAKTPWWAIWAKRWSAGVFDATVGLTSLFSSLWGQEEPLNLSYPCQELWCLSSQTPPGTAHGVGKSQVPLLLSTVMNCVRNTISSSLVCWKRGEGKRKCGARAVSHQFVVPSLWGQRVTGPRWDCCECLGEQSREQKAWNCSYCWNECLRSALGCKDQVQQSQSDWGRKRNLRN